MTELEVAILPPTLARLRLRPLPYLRRHVLVIALPLVALTDGLWVAATFLFFYFARFVWGWIAPAAAPPLGPYLHASVLVALIWMASLAFVGLYNAKRPASRFDDAMLTLAGLLPGALLSAGLASFYRSFSYSRLVFFYAFFGSLAVLWLWHLALRGLQLYGLTHGWGVLNTLIIGHNGLSETVARRLREQPRLGRVVCGVVAMPDEPGLPTDALGLPVLGRSADLARLLEVHAIDEVVVAWPAATPGQLAAIVRQAAATRPVNVQIAPDVLQELTLRLEVASLAGMPMLTLREVALRRWRNRLVKRAMDITLASLALVLAFPLMGVIALAVRLGSKGPALYAQERLGRDGHRFRIFKFRSMPLGAEELGPVWTKRGDDRATPLGAWLRRYSLDELPQLWNVLVGDMSLVGPRPERPFFVRQFQHQVPGYNDRHLVRCGLTGWAQVNGMRGDVDIDARTRYDIQYVENWSVLLDIRIMCMTLRAIFLRPGY